MATKKPKDNHAFQMVDDGTPMPKVMAKLMTSAHFTSVSASQNFTQSVMPDLSINEMAEQIESSIQQVQSGDMSGMEAMLVGQAHALQQVFVSLMRRASGQQYLKQYQTYMSMGLKAQAQSRATIQALTELKYPRQVVITKQANFAQGHQQVNNGAPTPAAENVLEQTELLERSNANTLPPRLDTRTPAKASRADSKMEAVGQIHRAQND